MTKLFPLMMCAAMAGTLAVLSGFTFAQEGYPNKPIRIICPYAAGGSATILAHLIGQYLNKSWGQPVVVDNRPGGNTTIGSGAMVKSAPDGYTILIVNSAHVINPNLIKTPYDAIRDFAPVATVVTTSYFLALNPAVPADTLKDFVALARARPGQFNYASTGNGSVTHLLAELFNMTAEIKMAHIFYKGSAPALVDLVAGQVQMFFSPPDVTVGFIKSGKLKALAISGEARFPALPQIPTFAEAGLPGFNITIWFGVLAPSGTPKSVIDKLSTEITKMLNTPDVRTNLMSQGLVPLTSTPEQFGAVMKADLAAFAKVIKAANIRGD